MKRILPLLLALVACAHQQPEPLGAADPQSATLWRDMAEWYLDNGYPDKALDMIHKLEQAGADDASTAWLHAQVLLRAGLPDEALLLVRDTLDADTCTPEGLRLLGLAHIDAGQPTEAIQAFERLVACDEDDAAARNNLGFLQLTAERCEEAAHNLERAVLLDSSNTRYRNNLGYAMVCLQRYERAERLFTSANPAHLAHYQLGLAYERYGHKELAAGQFDRAQRLQPDHLASRQALARLREESP